MRPSPRTLALFASLCALSALAGEKLLQNDNFTGTGTVAAPISFPEYAGAGVIVEPDAGDYPASLIAVDVFCAPAQGGASGDIGAYLLDVWVEQPDAGVTITPPQTSSGNRYSSGVQLTASTTAFNRFTFPNAITVTGGRIFIAVREQLQSSFDGTTIAMDTGPVAAGRNWYFNGFGGWSVITGVGSGTPQSVDRNWIIRGVLNQPDVPPVVTSISPASGTNELPVPVTVTGDHFGASSRVFLGTVELAVTSRVAPTTLFATVPAAMQAGLYDLIVENPAQPSALRGTLPQAYRVIDLVDAGTLTDGGTNPLPDAGTTGDAGAGDDAGTGDDGGTNTGTDGGLPAGLRLDSVAPAEVWSADTSELTLLGAAFDPEVQLLIGGKVLPSFERRNAAVIAATLAPRTLAAGTYDVTVINPDGAQSTLVDGLKVNDGTSLPAGCSCGTPGAGALFAGLGLWAFFARRRRSVTR